MSAVLELKNVTKVMDSKVLVDNLSFEVYPGEIFGFLGPNGAGKTTTIKMITGLYHMTKGEIKIQGHSVTNEFEKALENVGAIIENPEMYGYLTGRENLKLYAHLHKSVTKERMEAVIKLVKLENRIDDKVKKYSLGMRQRLGLAQALLHQPKLIILDEPTNGLDPVGIKELRETLRMLCETEGVAVVVSSHLLNEMEVMCDRFCIIDEGKFVGIRTHQDIKVVKEESGVHYIRVDDIQKAKRILNVSFNSLTFEDYELGLLVTCEKPILNQLIKELVLADIVIEEVTAISKSLEDEFMSLTTGSKKQIR